MCTKIQCKKLDIQQKIDNSCQKHRINQDCPTRGPRATSWPAMLSGVARVEIKVVKKLHSSYFGCKQGEKLTLFTGTTKARAFKKSFNLSFLTCRVTVD